MRNVPQLLWASFVAAVAAVAASIQSCASWLGLCAIWTVFILQVYGSVQSSAVYSSAISCNNN